MQKAGYPRNRAGMPSRGSLNGQEHRTRMSIEQVLVVIAVRIMESCSGYWRACDQGLVDC